MSVPPLTKADIRKRLKYLTKEGYQVIIDTVKEVHNKTLSQRTVYAYILGEKVGKNKVALPDTYQIKPVFIQVTDTEMERVQELMKKTSQKLSA